MYKVVVTDEAGIMDDIELGMDELEFEMAHEAVIKAREIRAGHPNFKVEVWALIKTYEPIPEKNYRNN